jgi:hypothetical protein
MHIQPRISPRIFRLLYQLCKRLRRVSLPPEASNVDCGKVLLFTIIGLARLSTCRPHVNRYHPPQCVCMRFYRDVVLLWRAVLLMGFGAELFRPFWFLLF